MNPNPYPQGRWTEVVAGAASRKTSRSRLTPELMASLVGAPLKELFWGASDASLVAEASQGVEVALGAAGCCGSSPEIHRPKLASS